ncbi:MAG: signal peptidase II [Verrucomicrobiia bacterium]
MSEQLKYKLSPDQTVALVSAIVAILDQITKLAVIEFLPLREDKNIIDGFFRLVYWGNTGAAWSLFVDNNELLTVISLIALLFLFLNRNRFEITTRFGQIAMGMIFGGIVGNLVDRLTRGHVVDFLYFYVVQRSGNELGFPAFNLADLSICLGVGIMLVLILTKKEEHIQEIMGNEDKSHKLVPNNEKIIRTSQEISRDSTSDK